MRNLTLKACAGVLLTGLALSLGACNGQQPVTAETVWDDMSPELETMALSEQQRTTRQKRAIDTNLRQLNEDWDYLWLIDRPSRLSDFPVP